MSALPPELTASRGTTPNGDRRGSKAGDLVRRLSSGSDGEVVATVRALKRELEAAGVGFHELALIMKCCCKINRGPDGIRVLFA